METDSSSRLEPLDPHSNIRNEPTFTGCLVLAKLLGVIEAEQTQDSRTHRNDRFIAVPLEAKSRKPAALAPASLTSVLVQDH